MGVPGTHVKVQPRILASSVTPEISSVIPEAAEGCYPESMVYRTSRVFAIPSFRAAVGRPGIQPPCHMNVNDVGFLRKSARALGFSQTSA